MNICQLHIDEMITVFFKTSENTGRTNQFAKIIFEMQARLTHMMVGSERKKTKEDLPKPRSANNFGNISIGLKYAETNHMNHLWLN